jgi:hypothetical protein
MQVMACSSENLTISSGQVFEVHKAISAPFTGENTTYAE